MCRNSIAPLPGFTPKSNGPENPGPFRILETQHSVQLQVCGTRACHVKLPRDCLCILPPRLSPHCAYAPRRWTRRDANSHLPLGQSAVLPLHHGPCCHVSTATWEPQGFEAQSAIPISQSGMNHKEVTRTFFLAALGSVSQAVRNTSRGARPRILIRYGTVRFASNFAASRSSQPRPFCTMSS
jgi:hypothetical protein